MDFSNLAQLANQLRDQLSQSQSEAANTKVTGEAGGGMVRVVLNGKYEVVELTIEPKVFEDGDRALAEDLIRAAFNQASTKVASELRQRMGNLAQSLGVDLAALGLSDPDK